MPPRVSVERVSKMFARHKATRGKRGLSTEGPAALRHLLSRVFSRADAGQPPVPGDPRYLAALDDVSLAVEPGEVLGIIGRNGAGKSTLLKILARVLHPTSGRITLRGRVVSMLELGIGFAPELTVRQNIQIHGRLAGVPTRRVRAAEEEILDFAGLTSCADQALGSCPGGSAVQLGFAAVICLGADILLADEVLAIGDSEFRRACEARVKAAGASGESVLFVSHDMSAIRRICTRVIWIDRGRIVRDGAADEVVHAYTTRATGRTAARAVEQRGAGLELRAARPAAARRRSRAGGRAAAHRTGVHRLPVPADASGRRGARGRRAVARQATGVLDDEPADHDPRGWDVPRRNPPARATCSTSCPIRRACGCASARWGRRRRISVVAAEEQLDFRR